MLSGGGRDRRLVQWGPGLVALQEAEVRDGLGSRKGQRDGEEEWSGAFDILLLLVDSRTLWSREGHC